MSNSYRTDIIKAIDRLEKNGTAPSNYDKSNTGTLMASVFLWKTVMTIATNYHKLALERLQAATEEEASLRERDVGEYVVAQSPKFTFMASLSNPAQLFSPDDLVSALNKSKYKIPAPIAREFINNAKKPGKKKLTLSVAEKADD